MAGMLGDAERRIVAAEKELAQAKNDLARLRAEVEECRRRMNAPGLDPSTKEQLKLQFDAFLGRDRSVGF